MILTNLPCFYCGEAEHPSGIDRFDNNQGYTSANAVPCCGQCNRAKFTYSASDFIAHCLKIARIHGEQGTVRSTGETPTLNPPTTATTPAPGHPIALLQSIPIAPTS